MDDIGATLGGQQWELAPILPELRQQPGFEEPGAIADREAAQFRLFSAYTRFIEAAASLTPLLLVLNDLHWTDKPTLLLLQHLARELASQRVLVVGTYRDTELARTHPRGDGFA